MKVLNTDLNTNIDELRLQVQSQIEGLDSTIKSKMQKNVSSDENSLLKIQELESCLKDLSKKQRMLETE